MVYLYFVIVILLSMCCYAISLFGIDLIADIGIMRAFEINPDSFPGISKENGLIIGMATMLVFHYLGYFIWSEGTKKLLKGESTSFPEKKENGNMRRISLKVELIYLFCAIPCALLMLTGLDSAMNFGLFHLFDQEEGAILLFVGYLLSILVFHLCFFYQRLLLRDQKRKERL